VRKYSEDGHATAADGLNERHRRHRQGDQQADCASHVGENPKAPEPRAGVFFNGLDFERELRQVPRGLLLQHLADVVGRGAENCQAEGRCGWHLAVPALERRS